MAVSMVFFCSSCHSHRFRNVTFEITSTGVGVFQVSARFMGVAMEKVELVFQVRNTIHARVSSLLTLNWYLVFVLLKRNQSVNRGQRLCDQNLVFKFELIGIVPKRAIHFST